jgi:hypothetical protein
MDNDTRRDHDRDDDDDDGGRCIALGAGLQYMIYVDVTRPRGKEGG